MTARARDQILRRLRAALGDPGSQPGVGDTLLMWQNSPPLHARPEAGRGTDQETGPGTDPEVGPGMDRFLSRVEQSGATWEQLQDESQLQDAVLAYCQRWGVNQLVLTPRNSPLTALTWPTGLVHNGRPASAGSAVVVRANLGVAETGSVLLVSDTHHTAALNVLPEHLLVVLDMGHVVSHLEEAMSPLCDGGMPWSASLVTGPSRTGDVEQTIALGAHGPRRVHLLLIPGTGL